MIISGTVALVPAPDYCIMTESKSGFFSSRSRQYMHEFPADLKEAHMQKVMEQLAGSQLVGYLQQVTLPARAAIRE